jgi:hypothetical protein
MREVDLTRVRDLDNHMVFRNLKEEIQDLDGYVLNILAYLGH